MIDQTDLILNKIIEIENALPERMSDIGLHTGESGKVLFYCYLSHYLKSNAYDSKIEHTIENIFERLDTDTINPTFCRGLSGLVWTMNHLRKTGMLEFDDVFADLHDTLKKSALGLSAAGEFDFLHGADGIIYTLMDNNALDEKSANAWLNSLYDFAIRDSRGCVWETLTDASTGSKSLNLSLSHGISGKIILLSEVLKRFPENELTYELLDGAVNFLLSCRNPAGFRSWFPSVKQTDQPGEISRLAWCYGDLGNAICLWRASESLQRTDLKQLAIELLLNATKRRNPDQEKIIDAAFCHGASGVSHIFRHFYQKTGMPELEQASNYWMQKTLDFSSHKDVAAGYKSFDTRAEIFKKEDSFLEGNIGIAMVMLNHLQPFMSENHWNECFLIH
ncbi:MAG: lanthionine synthetase C family protein [Bacteroidetes bacterium]|nr:lanthionine synthetase C family protein [Bacteroidota bacterium]